MAAGGGPPTIADFDGDGLPEVAAAGGYGYVIFNGEDGSPLWFMDTIDRSSRCTGSSVFDFEGDGAAEAVYADECFLRIYEGATGRVIFSAARSSGTTYENPVIVDVDGDYRTEIVSAVNDYAGTLGCEPASGRLADPLGGTGHHDDPVGESLVGHRSILARPAAQVELGVC